MTGPQGSRQRLWAGAAVLLVLMLGYMLFWWNRGIQLNSNGMGTLAAEDILAGKAPYLTFDFWCPPGHLLVYAGLAKLFGEGLIYVRAFAVVERMAIFLLVYFWLARVFTPRAAFLGTFAAGVGFSSDVADVLAHYDFDAVLASVAAGFAASVALSSTGRFARIMCFVTGLCAGVCMMAKQTQGVGMFLVLLVILAVGGPLLGVLSYLVGWAIPVAWTVLWLAQIGAWHAFVQQAFLQGTSSKGSLAEILLRPLFTLTYEHMLQTALAVALILMAGYGMWAWKERGDNGATERPQQGLPWVVWAACLLALVIGLAWAWWLPNTGVAPRKHQALIGFTAIGIFISMYGSAVLAVAYTWQALRRRLDTKGLQTWTLASVSAMTAYMFSLSWAAYEKMLIPGFAFIVAMALNRQLRRGWNLRAYGIAALALVLATTAVFRKMTWPYDWANWVDGPVKQETATSDFPEMRGMRVTPESAKFLSDVTRIIDEHSSTNQTIFCYPNYTLFYVLAHRAPATFGLMHWFDIASDAMAREDAGRIREHPPAVILFVDLPEEIIADNERKFRGGRRSGQRDLAATIQTMPGYRVIDTVPIPHKDYPLKIYARD